MPWYQHDLSYVYVIWSVMTLQDRQLKDQVFDESNVINIVM